MDRPDAEGLTDVGEAAGLTDDGEAAGGDADGEAAGLAAETNIGAVSPLPSRLLGDDDVPSVSFIFINLLVVSLLV